MATTTDCGNSAETPDDMRCCGGQGCRWCAGDDPPELVAIRARLGVRAFGGATWTPTGFGADRAAKSETVSGLTDHDDIQF